MSESGWEAIDDGEGNFYYHNASTGETTWDRPAEFGGGGDDLGETVEAAVEAVADDGDGWVAHQDDEGYTYYHNAATGETSWDPPPGFDAGGDAAAEAAPEAAAATPPSPGDGGGGGGGGGGGDAVLDELERRKSEAVENEDFAEAKRLKDEIARRRSTSSDGRAESAEIAELRAAKKRAIDAEDFAEAKRLKDEIARLERGGGAGGGAAGGASDSNKAAAEVCASEGLEMAKMGDLDGAIVKWRQAIAFDPRNLASHINLGVALEHKGDLDGSIAISRKAISIDANNPKAHYNLANALDEKGDFTLAIKAYRRSLEIDPSDEHCQNNLEIALQNKTDQDKKADLISPKYPAVAASPVGAGEAHKLRKGSISAKLVATGFKDKGNACLRQGDHGGAIHWYSEAIKIDEDNHILFSNRAAAHHASGDHDMAIEDADRCIILAPTWPKGHHRKATALHAAGQLDDSVAAYHTGLRHVPNDQDLISGLVTVLREQGDPSAERIEKYGL